MEKKKIYVMFIVLMILAVNGTAWGVSFYRIQEIGTFGGDISVAKAIDQKGRVVGYAKDRVGMDKAFVYNDGHMEALDTPIDQHSYAYDLNEKGVIIGKNVDPMDFENGRAWTLYRGVFTFIPNPAVPVMDVTRWHGLNSINSDSIAVGDVMSVSSDPMAVVYHGGDLILLNRGWDGSANDINDSGISVGYYGFNMESYACYWPKSLPDEYKRIKLWDSVANGINENDQIVGRYARYSDTGTQKIAFIYDINTGRHDDIESLGGPESIALEINDSGQVVGYADVDATEHHAFLYEEGELYDLNDLIVGCHGWDYLAKAVDINNDGQIIGEGYIAGERRGFLLTPANHHISFTRRADGLVKSKKTRTGWSSSK